jgi:hypothetical protein
MQDDNKHNLLYFEADTMRDLFEDMERWQRENRKRLLSASIERDQTRFCCIALTNPMETVIVDGRTPNQASVSAGALQVFSVG